MLLYFFILTLSELLIQKEAKPLYLSYLMRCENLPPPWGCAVILLSVFIGHCSDCERNSVGWTARFTVTSPAVAIR